MQADDLFSPTDKQRVLVVDDDRSTRLVHQRILEKHYAVEAVESGNDALQLLDELQPALIVLDVEMPGLDGYETCRRIRETSSVPIIFVTAHHSLESQLDAFAAGGNDIVHKPVSADIFLHRAALAIQTHENFQRLQTEKASLQSMAMNFLSSVGETGALLNFLRTSIQCRSYFELAGRLSEAARALNIQCYGVIRTQTGDQYFRSEGEPNRLEKDVLAQVAGMGRVFQFARQLVVNYDHVSIIATHVPTDNAERAGSLRDNLTILAETTESLTENVEMRQASMARAEQLQIALIGASAAVEALRTQHRSMLGDTRLLLQDLIDNVERSFSWIGATTEQERAITDTMNESVQKVLALLSTRGQFDAEFTALLGALRGPEQDAGGDVDFF